MTTQKIIWKPRPSLLSKDFYRDQVRIQSRSALLTRSLSEKIRFVWIFTSSAIIYWRSKSTTRFNFNGTRYNDLVVWYISISISLLFTIPFLRLLSGSKLWTFRLSLMYTNGESPPWVRMALRMLQKRENIERWMVRELNLYVPILWRRFFCVIDIIWLLYASDYLWKSLYFSHF